MKLEILNTAENVLQALTRQLISIIEESKSKPFHLALPGGEIAAQLFRLWTTDKYRKQIDWDNLRFYWTDEQCVPPDNDASHFKMADQLLFIPLEIPLEHIHQLWGNQNPETEAERYAEFIKWELPGYADIPRFDCIIPDVGPDGRIASISPATTGLTTDLRLYAVSQNPQTGQSAVTMTGTLILKSRHLLLPVIGQQYAPLIKKLMDNPETITTPAAYLLSHSHSAIVFTDCRI